MKSIQRCDSCGRWTTREQAAVWSEDLVFCVNCYGVSKDLMKIPLHDLARRAPRSDVSR